MKRQSQIKLKKLAARIQSISPRGRRRTRLPADIWAEVLRISDSGFGVADICKETGLKPFTVAKKLSEMRTHDVKTLVVQHDDSSIGGRSCEIRLPNGVQLCLSCEALTPDFLARLKAC